MSYLENPHYREAQRRAGLLRKCRTPLGRYWQQKQLVDALKAMICDGPMNLEGREVPKSSPVTCHQLPVTTRGGRA